MEGSSVYRPKGAKRIAKLLTGVLAGTLLVAAGIIGIAAGSDEAPAAKAGSSRPPVNVIVIGWDGAQRGHVKECLARGELRNLRAVADEGRLVAVDVVRTTDTKAGWAQILTGYQPEKNLVFSNSRFQPIPDGYTIFERLEQRYGPEFVTVAVVGKKGNVDYDAGKPYANAVADMEAFDNGLVENRTVAQRAMAYLEQYKSRPFFFFVHFAQPDHVGHAHGENSQQYTDGIKSDDYWTGRILAKLKALGLSGRTEVYITADHGFDEGLKSHGDAPYVFLATTDNSVMRRGLREDIAPTIYDRLGIPRTAWSPVLDGHSLRRAYAAPVW